MKFCFVALSIDPDKLENKLLKSIYSHYSPERLADCNFIVLCQGFEQDKLSYLYEKYKEVTFDNYERLDGTISSIRRRLLIESNVMNDYDYVIMIDDDFVFGPYAIDQYDSYLKDMEDNPDLGLISCHRRMSKAKRIEISKVECPYPQDLAVISMRTGLIIRSSAFKPDDLFLDKIMYHEEFYLALMIYIAGYEVGKGWIDVYHQSRNGGLGCNLQKKYNIFTSNEADTAKKVAYDLGLFTINDGEIFYGAQNVGRVSDLAIHNHNLALARRKDFSNEKSN